METQKTLARKNTQGEYLLEALVLVGTRRPFIFEDLIDNSTERHEVARVNGAGTPRVLYESLKKLDKLGYVKLEPNKSEYIDEKNISATLTKEGEILYRGVLNYLENLL